MQVLQVQLAVQADPAEVGRARRWVRSRLLNHGVDPDAPIAETVVLVVSELVTNAVVHTGSPAVLRLCFPMDGAAREAAHAPVGDTGGVRESATVGPLRVEVADASQAAPAPRHAGPDTDATSGRGLELVELLCDRWGWYPDGSGKRVWCEIGADAPPVDPLAAVDWAALAQ
ncbi:ATP-binding protein [Kitasatospora sp. A2-31]|uniref:ATP-binding protein n=1 Tax=Kitasatospora sp. A2-31 TaxID=2916414 RepID=UPI001EED0AED|nr:ATP-binding protein [Kitasatospora sp. A2-31]MCG6499580.1 ATP-binding protein [Kitasatospora sp. A2-31]